MTQTDETLDRKLASCPNPRCTASSGVIAPKFRERKSRLIVSGSVLELNQIPASILATPPRVPIPKSIPKARRARAHVSLPGILPGSIRRSARCPSRSRSRPGPSPTCRISQAAYAMQRRPSPVCPSPQRQRRIGVRAAALRRGDVTQVALFASIRSVHLAAASAWQPAIRKRSYAIPQRSLETLKKIVSLDPKFYDGIGQDRHEPERSPRGQRGLKLPRSLRATQR